MAKFYLREQWPSGTISVLNAPKGDTQSVANVANVLGSPPLVLPLERVYV
jgi:hypothetical protein